MGTKHRAKRESLLYSYPPDALNARCVSKKCSVPVLYRFPPSGQKKLFFLINSSCSVLMNMWYEKDIFQSQFTGFKANN